MESDDKPIERDMYHQLTWNSGVTDNVEFAIYTMKSKLLSQGYSIEFIRTMTFSTFYVTGTIFVTAGYWN